MKAFFSAMLLTSCLFSFAQDGMKSEMWPEMSRGVGVSFQKFSNLDSRIAAFPQYKELKHATGVLQLGWFSSHHQFITNFDLMAGSSMSGDRDKRSSTIRYLGVGADIGYDFIKSEKVLLYPLVGIGYQKYQARFFVDHTNVNFNDVLTSTTVQNNIRALDFKNGFFDYRLGIGIAAKSTKHNCSIGVRAMYTGSFTDHAWKSSDEQSLANAPVDKLSQIYAGLVFTCRPFFMMHKGHM